METSRPGRQLVGPLLAGAGAIGSAVLALSCCVAPMALASLGLGSLGAAALTQHARPLFLGLSVAFIGYTTWLNIRNRRRLASAAAACACDVGSARRTARALNVTLFAASIGVVVLLASPRLVALVKPPVTLAPAQALAAAAVAGAPAAPAGGVKVSFPVTGVACDGCAATIHKALSSVQKIDSFSLDVPNARFSFIVASPNPPLAKFADAVKAAGYVVGPATVTQLGAAPAGSSCACHGAGQ